MCGRVRKLFAASADGSRLKICGSGLTRIINSSTALGKLTRRAQWDAIVLTDVLYPSEHCELPMFRSCSRTCPSDAQMDWTHVCGWDLWRSGQKASRGLSDWQRTRHSICLRTRSRICGQNPRTDADRNILGSAHLCQQQEQNKISFTYSRQVAKLMRK